MLIMNKDHQPQQSESQVVRWLIHLRALLLQLGRCGDLIMEVLTVQFYKIYRISTREELKSNKFCKNQKKNTIKCV